MPQPHPRDVRRRLGGLSALVGLLSLLSLPGAAAADPAAGEVLAKQWCANCHATAPGRRTTDAAPSFSEVAARADLGRDRLRTWLSTPHAGMPDLSLSRQDIDAVIDYLQSLPR